MLERIKTSGDIAAVEYLISHGYCFYDDEDDVLRTLSIGGHLEAIKLIDRTEVFYPENVLRSCQNAIYYGHFDILKHFVPRIVEIYMNTDVLSNLFGQAVSNGSIDMCEYLLPLGVDVTAAHQIQAARTGNIAMIRYIDKVSEDYLIAHSDRCLYIAIEVCSQAAVLYYIKEGHALDKYKFTGEKVPLVIQNEVNYHINVCMAMYELEPKSKLPKEMHQMILSFVLPLASRIHIKVHKSVDNLPKFQVTHNKRLKTQ